MPNCDVNKVALHKITIRHGVFHVNLLHIFRTQFLVRLWRPELKGTLIVNELKEDDFTR